MSDQQQSTTQAFPSSDQQQSSTQAFVKKTAAQRKLYESGNELAAYAAKQINYHIMGYYPITPSTQIAENLDLSGARGEHNIRLIAAEGEHSAAGICYGASAGGGRVFNATSANGLLYALEQFPVQSGTRMPMVMNVACRTVSGPLCIKGDHSDIMYLLNTGWIILFADDPQMVYDFNLIALKLAEKVNLPVVVAFDGFFTSHQKQKCMVFSEDETVQHFIGKKLSCDNPEISTFAGNDSTGENRFYSVLDLNHPVSVGSYMNEPDIINNKYQLFPLYLKIDNLLHHLNRRYLEILLENLLHISACKIDRRQVLTFLLVKIQDLHQKESHYNHQIHSFLYQLLFLLLKSKNPHHFLEKQQNVKLLLYIRFLYSEVLLYHRYKRSSPKNNLLYYK